MPSWLHGSSLLLHRASNQHREVRKLSENQEFFAEKVAKSGYFPLSNVWNDGISENLYKFASNDNKFYMEQDLNRIKLVISVHLMPLLNCLVSK